MLQLNLEVGSKMTIKDIKADVLNEMISSSKKADINLTKDTVSRCSKVLDIISEAENDIYIDNGIQTAEEYEFYFTSNLSYFVIEIGSYYVPVDIKNNGGTYLSKIFELTDGVSICSGVTTDESGDANNIIHIKLYFSCSGGADDE